MNQPVKFQMRIATAVGQIYAAAVLLAARCSYLRAASPEAIRALLVTGMSWHPQRKRQY
jgi:hypothetical protein